MYSRFSEKHGFVKPRELIQRETMDDPLKNAIWNVFHLYFDPDQFLQDRYGQDSLNNFHRSIKMFFFEETLDGLTGNIFNDHIYYKKRFFSLDCHGIYDFVDFLIDSFPNNIGEANQDALANTYNAVFIKYLSAYRIIGNSVVEITDQNQIDAIENAIVATSNNKYNGVRIYLEKALKLLSDREKPDYSNSMKESISAVESLCKVIAEDDNIDLFKALKIVKEKLNLHGAFTKGLDSIYAYASDTVRHGKVEHQDIGLEDAVFMLVNSSTFISYLIVKANKAGIDFSK